MIGKGLVKNLTAAFVVAACGFVVIIALGATLYFALQLAMPPLGAAALTAGGFGLIALVVALVFLRSTGARERHDLDEDPSSGLGARALALFRQRPILGTVAALAGGWIVLRNPALVTMLAAAFADKPRTRSRR